MEYWMIVGIPVLLFAMLAVLCCNCTVDDAFISFRYARNLAEGNGLVFNVGEHVEGFSNPFWVFMLALFHIARMDIVITSKAIGLACGAFTLLLTRHLCRRTLGMSNEMTLFVLCYLATNVSFVYYAISGMETIFYTFCVVLMNYLLAERKEIFAGGICGVLSLTRPEGILFIIPLTLGSHLYGCKPQRIGRILIIPTTMYALLVAFRLLYFGTILPNTHGAKVGTMNLSLCSLMLHVKTFLGYTWHNSSVDHPLLFLAVVGTIILASRSIVPLLAAIGCAAFFVWYARYDWMSFWRFYVPVLPFIAALAFVPIDTIRYTVERSYRRQLVLVVCLFLIVVNLIHTVKNIQELKSGEQFNPAMHSRPHVRIGEYLRKIGSPSDVVVVNEIGAIGYYSNLTVIDMFGLTDRSVPSLRRQKTLYAYADYILSRKPTFILLSDKQMSQDTKLHPLHAAIYDKMIETGLYEAGTVFPLNSYTNLMLFVRHKPEGDEQPHLCPTKSW